MRRSAAYIRVREFTHLFIITVVWFLLTLPCTPPQSHKRLYICVVPDHIISNSKVIKDLTCVDKAYVAHVNTGYIINHQLHVTDTCTRRYRQSKFDLFGMLTYISTSAGLLGISSPNEITICCACSPRPDRILPTTLVNVWIWDTLTVLDMIKYTKCPR